MCRGVCNLFVFYVFSQEEGEQPPQRGAAPAHGQAVCGWACGQAAHGRVARKKWWHQVDGMGQMEVVSKTCVYFRVKMSVNELLVILKLIFFVETMIGNIIEGDTMYPQIHCQTPRSTCLVLRTSRPSLIEVSDVVIEESGVNGVFSFRYGDNNDKRQ